MSDLCNDNRFELIEKYKKELIEATNIETAPDEMAVLDTILFRFWQMGWLDKLELPSAQPIIILCRDCIKQPLCKFSQYQGDDGYCKLAEPRSREERKGHWIDDGFYADGYPHHVYRCSECDSSRLSVSLYGLSKVCPNCKVKMEQENK